MKKKLIIIASATFLLLLVIVGIIFFIKHNKERKQREIELNYVRQNFAFEISTSYGLNFLNQANKQFHGYDSIRLPGYLYARLLLYKHDTGNILTMEEIEEYLSKEYEDDGSLRMSKNHPKIQEFIDFICYSAGYTETGEEIRDDSFFPPTYRLYQFERGIEHARVALPYPYNIKDLDESKDYVWFGDFPDEIVEQAVDWVFESGWMDLKTDEEYDAWMAKYKND